MNRMKKADPLKVAIAFRPDGRIVGVNIGGLKPREFRKFFVQDDNYKTLRFAWGVIRQTSVRR